LGFEELLSMSTTATHVAHHFDDAQQQYQAASLGMWLFLATEILFFGGLFAGYTQYRSWYPAEFAYGSHHLDVWLGAINTAVLLTSSLTMALAVLAAQTNDRDGAARFLALTIVLGSVFLGVKAYEYHHKYQERLVPGPLFLLPTHAASTNHSEPSSDSPEGQSSLNQGPVEIFFSFYFAMTGLHALHMVIGIAVLVVLMINARRGAYSAEYFTPVELTGLYWHFVDIVWVFLFPLLYLIR
jgi:cytochrome c oxidase subunit 3